MNRRSGFKIVIRLLKEIKDLSPVIILSVIYGVLGSLAATVPFVAAAYFVVRDHAIKGMYGTIIFIALLRGVMHYLEQYCNHYIAFRILAIIRKKVFKKLRALAPAKLDNKDKGGLISIVTSDIELLEVFYAHTISPVLIALIYSIVMLIFFANISIVSVLIAFLGYGIVGILIPYLTGLSGKKAGMDLRSDMGTVSSYVLDNIDGIDEVLQYNAGEKRLKELDEMSDDILEKQADLSETASWQGAFTEIIILIFSCVMLMYLADSYMAGNISFNRAIIGTVAMLSSFGPVTALANLSNNLNQTFASGERVLRLLEEEPVTKEIKEGSNVVFSSASLENVTFSYDDKNNVLNNISYDFPKKKIIGIVGKSGSGKSTILKLLMRFWDAKSGSVKISRQDIREISTDSLRGEEGYVTQDTFIFNDTAAANIAVGKKNATLDEIREAAKKAAIDDVIMALPCGYDTLLGRGNVELSAGERQRIGVARAFLHESPLLLLDEPTSNLDALSEGVILKTIDEASKDRTVILVSHRKSTVGIADTIYQTEEPVREV